MTNVPTTDIESNLLSAVVLCGGRSVRMGTDKANLTFGNEKLVQRICRRTAEAANPVVVVAAPGQTLPLLSKPSLVVRDLFPGEGPLGGILTGLQHLREVQSSNSTAVWVSGCDMPFVNSQLIRALHERLGDSDAVAVEVEGRLHPLAAVYRTSCLPLLADLFCRGERRVSAFLDELNVKAVPSQELCQMNDVNFFQDVNTPRALQAALAILHDHPNI